MFFSFIYIKKESREIPNPKTEIRRCYPTLGSLLCMKHVACLVLKLKSCQSQDTVDLEFHLYII